MADREIELITGALGELARLAQQNTPLDGTTIEAIAARYSEGGTLEAAHQHVTAKEEEARYEVKFTDRTVNPMGNPRLEIRGGDRYRSLLRGILDNHAYTLIYARRLEG